MNAVVAPPIEESEPPGFGGGRPYDGRAAHRHKQGKPRVSVENEGSVTAMAALLWEKIKLGLTLSSRE